MMFLLINIIGGFGDSDNDVRFSHAQVLAVKTAAISLLFAFDEPHRDTVTITISIWHIFATIFKNKKIFRNGNSFRIN